MTFEKIYLASASPRRHELLNQMGVPHDVLQIPPPPGEDEPIFNGESPTAYVQRTALDKAKWAQAWLTQDVNQIKYEARPLLTADTTVALGDEILGKPLDHQDAFEILSKLSGVTHQVHTAVVIVSGVRVHSALATSLVSFKSLSPYEIEQYIETGEPWGKAGAYGIQGVAAMFISHLAGSYSNVVGLPLFETAQLLSTV